MNTVQLIGRLTKDPDVRVNAQSQQTIARFSIAIDRMPDKNGEKKTDFPNIVCFGKTAELVEKYIKKGRLIGVVGRIQTGSYQDKDGKTVYTTDVIADRVEFLDKAPEGEQKTEASPAPAPRAEAKQVALGDDLSMFERIKDEDIPF